MILENPSRSIWMDLCMMFADVYVCQEFLNARDWYVKFSSDSEGNAHLNVLSANIDGYIH